MLWTGPE